MARAVEPVQEPAKPATEPQRQTEATTAPKKFVSKTAKQYNIRCNQRLTDILAEVSKARNKTQSDTIRMLIWLGYHQYLINQGDGITTRSKSRANRKRILAEQAKRKEQEAQEIQRIMDATIITLD